MPLPMTGLPGTGVTRDALVLAVVLLVVSLLGGACLLLVRRLPNRPLLPEADRPPTGLGRLVPVGAQVDEEFRRGLLALESWLAASRRTAS